MHFQLNSAMSKNKPGVPFHKLQNCISSHQKGKIGSKKVSHDARLTERVREVVKKTNILQLQEFPTPSYCRCCSVTKRSNSGIAEALRAPYGQPDRKISVFYAFPYHKFRPVVALLYTHNYGLKKDNLKCEHVMI